MLRRGCDRLQNPRAFYPSPTDAAAEVGATASGPLKVISLSVRLLAAVPPVVGMVRARGCVTGTVHNRKWMSQFACSGSEGSDCQRLVIAVPG